MPRRLRTLACLLVALAVLSQLVTPTLYASNWAKHNGEGLLYAFCGTVSPALIAKMSDIAPPGLLPFDNSNHAQTELCLSVGILAGSFVLAAVFVLLLFQHRPSIRPALRPAPDLRLARTAYQSRAPPPCTA